MVRVPVPAITLQSQDVIRSEAVLPEALAARRAVEALAAALAADVHPADSAAHGVAAAVHGAEAQAGEGIKPPAIA